jgi:uncharacterized protein (DUF4415 family)
MAADRPRRLSDPRSQAEAAFKAATTKPLGDALKGAPSASLKAASPSVPKAKEMVSLRIDRDVLDYFQEDGPGWQERINEALRKAAGK